MMEKSEGEKRAGFPGIIYAEPAALGLLANVMSALIVAIENIVIDQSTPTSQLAAGIHLIVIGGIFQLLSGLMSFRRNDHFTATSLVLLSSLWTMYGINHLVAPYVDPEVLKLNMLPGLVGYCACVLILFVCALTVNYLMPPVLLATLLALIFEAVGLFHVWGRRVAIVFELFIALTGSYAVLMMVLKGVTQRYVMPGFGNAPYNVLLVKTKTNPSKQKEDKRNTKYAEPFAMGYIGNIVPAVVFVFHQSGYFSNFALSLPSLTSALFCQLFATYYCYLRHDIFHATQFLVSLLFWLCRGLIFVLTPHRPWYGMMGFVCVSLVLTAGSIVRSKMALISNASLTLVAILSIDAIPSHVLTFTFSISAAIFALISVYTSVASFINTIGEKTIFHIGVEIVTHESLAAFCRKLTFWNKKDEKGDKSYSEQEMFVNLVDGVCFIGTTLASLALFAAWVDPSDHDGLSHKMAAVVTLIAGFFVQIFATRLSFVTRSLSKCYTHVVYGVTWLAWSAVLYKDTFSPTLRSTSIALASLHVTIILLSVTFKRIWIPFSVEMLLNATCLVLFCYGLIPAPMLPIIMMLLGVTSFYGTVASFINGILRSQVLPVGEPLLKNMNIEEEEEEEKEPPCPLFSSRLTSGVREIAAIMDEGGVCGIPTDTVYALSTSCKYPESIVRIFNVKGRSREKPMCLCLAYLDQLVAVKPDFSPRLWAFMRRCYPGGISCVVPKGPWLDRLGIGHASRHIGTENSVCIRVPDSTPLAHLISMTGPVVLTSANPSGEVDSTHHDMVVHRLGNKLDGVLCDGSSRELVASTVVNCLNIDQGEISYFRVGCYPKEKVDAIFEEVMSSTAA